MTNPHTPTPSNSVVTDLKPCPFCGGAAEIANQRWNKRDHYGVVCIGDCGVFLDERADTRGEAAAAWNTRAAMQSANTTGSDELADDIRYIAAHSNDPRHEERLYEAADVIDAAKAIRRLGYGLTAPQSEQVATAALNAIATPDTDRVAVLEEVLVSLVALWESYQDSDLNQMNAHDCLVRYEIWNNAIAALSQPLGSQENQRDEPKPGTLEYAQQYHEEMTRRKPGETDIERARRHYYQGFDDDGLPCD